MFPKGLHFKVEIEGFRVGGFSKLEGLLLGPRFVCVLCLVAAITWFRYVAF